MGKYTKIMRKLSSVEQAEISRDKAIKKETDTTLKELEEKVNAGYAELQDNIESLRLGSSFKVSGSDMASAMEEVEELPVDDGPSLKAIQLQLAQVKELANINLIALGFVFVALLIVLIFV